MTDQPSAEMQVFAPFAGRTWTGRGPSGEGGDVARWEFILGGRALQVTHRLIGDTYGGRTIIFFEGKTGRYVFHCHNLEHEDMGMMVSFAVED